MFNCLAGQANFGRDGSSIALWGSSWRSARVDSPPQRRARSQPPTHRSSNLHRIGACEYSAARSEIHHDAPDTLHDQVRPVDSHAKFAPITFLGSLPHVLIGVHGKITAIGLEVEISTPEQLRCRFREEDEQWLKAIAYAGIQPE